MNSNFSLRDGYDLALYGISDGTFYGIHIPAIICIATSFTCAVLAIVFSFRSKSYKTFFSRWSNKDRIVVYSAICDGLFNIAHITDHMQILIARSHVYPRGFCEFYAFILAEFITAQILMVNIVAITAFVLVRWDKHINFGTKDCRILLWTFGAPFVGATIAGGLGKFGPTGSFSYFVHYCSRSGNLGNEHCALRTNMAQNTSTDSNYQQNAWNHVCDTKGQFQFSQGNVVACGGLLHPMGTNEPVPNLESVRESGSTPNASNYCHIYKHRRCSQSACFPYYTTPTTRSWEFQHKNSPYGCSCFR
ncbi:uncharacterized protein LOC127877179 [Dreissena polymorpha]|nr:uncharacterized protein LOC127877179 [Dreissena polymorpha]